MLIITINEFLKNPEYEVLQFRKNAVLTNGCWQVRRNNGWNFTEIASFVGVRKVQVDMKFRSPLLSIVPKVPLATLQALDRNSPTTVNSLRDIANLTSCKSILKTFLFPSFISELCSAGASSISFVVVTFPFNLLLTESMDTRPELRANLILKSSLI